MTKYLLTHCSLYDSKTEHFKKDMGIYVENGIIMQIKPSSKLEHQAVDQTFDMKQHYVLPGLINAHSHLFGSGKPMKALSNSKAQERLFAIIQNKLGYKILRHMVLAHAQEALHSGVTTIRAVGDFFYTDLDVRDAIAQNKCVGPRILASGPAITVTGGHGAGSFANVEDSPWEARKYVRENIHHQADLIKICVTGGVTDTKEVGRAGLLKMTGEEISAICEEAHKLGCLVAAHAESKEGVKQALLSGVDTIEHGSDLDDEMISLFLNNPRSLRGFSALVPTLYAAIPIVYFDPKITFMNPVNVANGRIVLDGMIEGIKKAKEAGVLTGLGTDASLSFVTHYNTWRELEFEMKLAGLTSREVLKNATIQNAKILGIEQMTGSIEVGKSADIIAVHKNPLKDIRALKEVSFVMQKETILTHPKVDKQKMTDTYLDNVVKKLS